MCTRLAPPPGPSCESFDASLSICTGLARTLHADRGAKLMACIAQQSGTEGVCDFMLIENCVAPALTAAGAPAADICRARRCVAESPRSECEAALHLTRTSLTSAVASCLVDHCSNWSCLLSVGGDPETAPSE